MKKLRTILSIMIVLMISYILITMDYSDLSWHVNKSNYLGVFSGLLTIIVNTLSNVKESKQKK